MIRYLLWFVLFFVVVTIVDKWPKISANYVACRQDGGTLDVCIVGAGAGK